MAIKHSSEKPSLVTAATHPLLLPGVIVYLGLVLVPIGLKLFGVIRSPWWKVLIPFWAPWPLIGVLACILVGVRVVEWLRQ